MASNLESLREQMDITGLNKGEPVPYEVFEMWIQLVIDAAIRDIDGK